ncbi:MAG: coagulation factor 5/8 type domain-containing protein [Phycisphaerales bacterium]
MRRKNWVGCVCAAAALAGVCIAAPAPDFGPGVCIIDGASADAQKRVDAIYAKQEAGQFDSGRYAILFKPGTYKLTVPVGFYTQVCGLGRNPGDVEIVGAVRSTARWMANRNATCNFWRSAENLSVTPTVDGGVNIWAVSQATSLRRVRIKGDVHLWDGGWSSGGFLADSVVEGKISSGSQQQWFSRNCDWKEWEGGNWNMVFVGVTNPPAGQWPGKPYTTIERAPVVREKPFLFVEGDEYFVCVPPVRREASGISWKEGETPGEKLPLSAFYIARSERDDAKTINAALEAGKHLLLTPGIYRLDAPLRINKPGTVVLGMGFATLSAVGGGALLELADVDGLCVGGLILEAGEKESAVLMEVGKVGSKRGHAADPIVLFDISCRAGGAVNGVCGTFVTVHASDVVGENLWLWRADHGEGAGWKSNRNAHGLIVNGDNVTMYGLFVEHTQEYQTIWNGEGGRVYFYQSEMPYDPPSAAAWKNGSKVGFASYKVADTVRRHDAWGLGVYCVFVDASIIAESAIEAPETPGVRLRNMIAVRLSGKPDSGIRHVLNGMGDPVIDRQVSRLLSN